MPRFDNRRSGIDKRKFFIQYGVPASGSRRDNDRRKNNGLFDVEEQWWLKVDTIADESSSQPTFTYQEEASRISG